MKTSKYRKRNIHTESIDHIAIGYKLLAATDYIDRHNNIGEILHLALTNKHKLANTNYYKYVLLSVVENDTRKIYRDNSILTGKTITANRPDITLIDRANKTTYIIDTGI